MYADKTPVGRSFRPCSASRIPARVAQVSLDITDGLLGGCELDGMPAGGAGTVDGEGCVVEEHDLLGRGTEPLSGQRVRLGVGLGHANLVGVHEDVARLVEAVPLLLPFAGANEAVAQDASTPAGPQPPKSREQLDVQAPEVLLPQQGPKALQVLIAHR